MASHVLVLDATARRQQIKTLPSTHLSDVLQEACQKFGVNAALYELKHNNKPVDLSRTIRLSGLSPGAKLNLVQASRSPSVVDVALQIPTSSDTPVRLQNKFPSNTSVWQILRRFESGAAGSNGTSKPNYNFTQRATPVTKRASGSGAGRLCYEMPVVQIEQRQLSSIQDLQKSLRDIGYNSGRVLLRLSYRQTQQPLEEAMTEISQYFEATDQTVNGSTEKKDDAIAAQETSQKHGAPYNLDPTPSKDASEDTQSETAAQDLDSSASMAQQSTQTESGGAEDMETLPDANASQANGNVDGSSNISGITVFVPSTTSAVESARRSHNDADFVPTVAHAQLHQSRLNTEARNKRLLSDKELAEQAQARTQQLASVHSITTQVRFPDGTRIQMHFNQTSTVEDLYEVVTEAMGSSGDATNSNGTNEFSLKVPGKTGKLEELPRTSGSLKLIRDLGWTGNVLVTFIWADDVDTQRRAAPVLREDLRRNAQQLKVEVPEAQIEDDEKGKSLDAAGDKPKSKESSSIADKEAKMRKMLGFGKFGKK